MGSGRVVVVASDERWLRVLEVTLRLGGYEPVTRRSVGEAARMRFDDDRPRAFVLDLGVDSMETDVEALRGLLAELELNTIVILPDRLSAERPRFEAGGTQVLVRPYRPSVLYAAIETQPPGRPRREAADARATADEPDGPGTGGTASSGPV